MSLLDTIVVLNAELDKFPDAHDTRRILADALEEMGGEWAILAPGYRAIAALRLRPAYYGAYRIYWNRARINKKGLIRQEHPNSGLPWFWFRKMFPKGCPNTAAWRGGDTRREAEDSAALAFSLLPPERQAELLRGAEVVG